MILNGYLRVPGIRFFSASSARTWYLFFYLFFYAYGKEDPLLTTAPCYLLLGRTPKERQEIYRKMVKEILMNDWKEKRPYSSIYFIGNPEWVQKKNRELEEIRQQTQPGARHGSKGL
jgi:hypothetical protein